MMLTGLSVMFYLGGMFAHWDRRIGFLNRISWPYTLGRVVAEWAFDMDKKGETE